MENTQDDINEPDVSTTAEQREEGRGGHRQGRQDRPPREHRGHHDGHRDRPHHPGGPERGRHGGRGGRHRMFDYGEFRLLLLAMICERPSHGYELIKAVDERSGGSYVPSPGVAYPTLAWLDDMGYAVIEPEENGRKLYRITPEGQAFLDENRAMADRLLSRLSPSARGHVPPPVLRAMENVKFALRLRLNQETVTDETIGAIAATLDAAAQAIERS